MNIITAKEKKGRFLDGIDSLLALDDETFDEVICYLDPRKEMLENISFYYITDGCEAPKRDIKLGLEKSYDDKGNFIGRGYYGGKRYSTAKIFKALAERLEDLEEDSKEYKRIVQLLKTRGLEAFKLRNQSRNRGNAEIYEKLFEILSDDRILEKFLRFNENSEYFFSDGKERSIGDYLIQLGNFFGKKDENGHLSQQRSIWTDYYIPDLQEYAERYSRIYDEINVDRYVNPTYEFKRFIDLDHLTDTVIRKDKEPEWQISEELYDAIYRDMPKDLSIEEQILYIYCKLCHELSYDEGYFYRNRIGYNKYSSKFSKENLERIKPGSKITCWDFSRLFSKFVNQIEGDLEAVIISTGANEGHFLSGFYTDKVSVMLEAINGVSTGTNDLMKAKHGIEFGGIKIVSDREGIVKRALDKVYPMIYGNRGLSLQEFIEELREIKTQTKDVPKDIGLQLEAFAETMKKSNICGNEAIQTFNLFYYSGFFEEELETAYVGIKEIQDNKRTYKRTVLIRKKKEEEQKGEDDILYLLNSDSLSVSRCSTSEIIEKLSTGEFVYEDKRYRIHGIDVEGK